MTEKEYRDLPSEKYFSYSFLKHFDDIGPKQLIEPKEYDNSGIYFGSIVHTLALSPHDFEDNYYVSEIEKDLTDTEKKLYDIIIENNKITEEFISSEKFTTLSLNYIKTLNLWSNIKDEEKLKLKLNSNFKKHVFQSTLIGKKTIVSPTEYLDAVHTHKILKSSEFTKDYFSTKDIKKKEILFEIPILYKVEGDNFKSLLDIILIDHEVKIIRALDLKTGAKPNKYFKYEFINRRYDIQAFLYTKALETYIEANGLKDYSILEPLYIYTCRFTPESPLPFEVSYDVLINAYVGFTTYTGRNYSGILDLVKDIKWHRANNIYNYTREEYENKKLEISKYDFGIKSKNNNVPNNLLNIGLNLTNGALESLSDSMSSRMNGLYRSLETATLSFDPSISRRR